MNTDFVPLRANLGNQVFEYLRDRIYRLVLLPGSRLGVGEIADQLGVSRSPVRDAFHLLMAEGLIVPGPANGYRVIEFDRKYIEDVFVVRRSLELLAVQLATENLNVSQVEQLRLTWQQLRQLQDDDPQMLEMHLTADTELHQAISEMSRNTVLQNMLDKIITRAALIRRWVFANGVTPAYLVGLAEEHLCVLEALLSSEAENAMAAMSNHLQLGQARALKRLDSN